MPSQASSTGSTWVSKTDRHLQLINTSVFEKESQQRTKALEESRQQKLKQKDEREKRRFAKQLQRSSNNFYDPSASKSVNGTMIDIEGIPFRVTKNGDKLMKVAGEDSHAGAYKLVGRINNLVIDLQYLGDPHPPSATPKTWLSGGTRFFRSKKGNLYRAGIVKAHR